MNGLFWIAVFYVGFVSLWVLAMSSSARDYRDRICDLELKNRIQEREINRLIQQKENEK